MNTENANLNYPDIFIKDLQKDVQKALAKTINKENSTRKLDLGLKVHTRDYLKLSAYNSILNNLLNCSTCNTGFTVEQIVSNIKNRINALS